MRVLVILLGLLVWQWFTPFLIALSGVIYWGSRLTIARHRRRSVGHEGDAVLTVADRRPSAPYSARRGTVEPAARFVYFGSLERALLARRLLASLDEGPETDTAWSTEVRRRLEACRAGELESESG